MGHRLNNSCPASGSLLDRNSPDKPFQLKFCTGFHFSRHSNIHDWLQCDNPSHHQDNQSDKLEFLHIKHSRWKSSHIHKQLRNRLTTLFWKKLASIYFVLQLIALIIYQSTIRLFWTSFFHESQPIFKVGLDWSTKKRTTHIFVIIRLLSSIFSQTALG